MACGCTEDEIEELELLKEDRTKVREAIRKVLSGGQSYTLDTSQSRVVVSQATLGELRKYRDELNNEIQQLEAKCAGGGGTVYGMPGF